MKNQNRFTLFSLFIISLFIICFACNKDNDCDGAVSLKAVLPNSNPPGSEVQIIGEGLTVNPEIRFGGQLAKTEFSAEKGGLIAIVPDKVIGLVDLTIASGDCLVRTKFEVLGALPGSVVASPTVIVVPILPANFPSNLSNQSVRWENYYDSNHAFEFYQNKSCTNFTNTKVEFDAIELHATNAFLNNNPIKATYNCSNGILELKINRTGKGGKIEEWSGNVVEPALLGIKDSDANGNSFLLLTAKASGRQGVFFSFN